MSSRGVAWSPDPQTPPNWVWQAPADPLGSLGLEPPGRGRAWRGYRSRPAPRGPVGPVLLWVCVWRSRPWSSPRSRKEPSMACAPPPSRGLEEGRVV